MWEANLYIQSNEYEYTNTQTINDEQNGGTINISYNYEDLMLSLKVQELEERIEKLETLIQKMMRGD